MTKLQECLQIIEEAVKFLITSNKTPRILIKISRNMGDSLHSQPIIEHYRTKYPDACIVFLTEQRYHNAHEHNPYLDGLFLLPNDLDSQTRLALWDPIKTNKNIDIAIIPAINPFQAIHPENKWLEPHPNIVRQYLHNAGIAEGELMGSGRLIIDIDDDDKKWASDFLLWHNIVGPFVCFEYNSYSASMAWRMPQYAQFVQLAKAEGFQCVGVAGTHEKPVPGAIDMRGATWRQTTAVLSHAKYMVGCSSGNTMLALGSCPQPFLIELNAPADCLASETKYISPRHCINLVKPTPQMVVDILEH